MKYLFGILREDLLQLLYIYYHEQMCTYIFQKNISCIVKSSDLHYNLVRKMHVCYNAFRALYPRYFWLLYSIIVVTKLYGDV